MTTSQCGPPAAGTRMSGAGNRKHPIRNAGPTPIRREMQEDGRIRFWGRIMLIGETRPRVLRVVTLQDGETIHNAFFDRNFREEQI